MTTRVKYLRVCSDLHLEFYPSRPLAKVVEELLPKDPRDLDSLLVLAGDISSDWDQLLQFFTQIHARFKQILYVPGNHEYYGHEMKDWEDFATVLEDTFNIWVTGNDVNQSFMVNDFLVMATTLWADAGGAGSLSAIHISRWPDFRRIQTGKGRGFTVEDMIKMNKAQANFIQDYLYTFHGKPKIVVTHHLPSYSLCDKKYSPSLGDGLFASNQDKLFSNASHAPALWIFGHTHTHVDKVLNVTRALANPAGYPNESDVNYNPRLFINLEELEIASVS